MGNFICLTTDPSVKKIMFFGLLLWAKIGLGVCTHSDAHPMLLELLECSEKRNKIPMFSEMLKSDFFQKVISPGLVSICQDGCHLVREEAKLKQCYAKMALLFSNSTYETTGPNGQIEKFYQYIDRMGKEKYSCRMKKDVLDKYLSLNPSVSVSSYESCIYTKTIPITPANINCGSETVWIGEVYCSFGPHRGSFRIACQGTEEGRCPEVAECAEGEHPFWIHVDQGHTKPISEKLHLTNEAIGQ